jgi:predicted MFS family arabinose efflux permease
MLIVMVGTAASSAFYGYVGVWAIRQLGASAGQIGVMFVFDASFAAIAGYLGGGISDRVGRRTVIVVSFALQAIVIAACAFVGHHKLVGLILIIVAATVGTPSLAMRNALVADIAAPDRQERAYSAMRIVINLATVAGPVLAAVLLLGEHWSLMFLVLAALGLLASAGSMIMLPSVRPQRRSAVNEEQPGPGLASMLRDTPFALLLVSTLLGFMIYVAYETVLPIMTVSAYGFAPSTWGFLAIVNPLMVIAFQARITRRAEPVAAGPKIGLSMLLMGLPFVLLLVNHSVPVIVGVIVVFVIGEMLWSPASQALAARLSPPHRRGAYLGAFGSSMSVAWALSPLVSLGLLNAGGQLPVWLFFAVIALLGAVMGWVAGGSGTRSIRSAGTRRPAPSKRVDSAARPDLSINASTPIEESGEHAERGSG